MAESELSSAQRFRVGVVDSTRMNSQVVVGALKRCRNGFDVQAITGNFSGAFRELQNRRPHVAVISAQLEDGHLTGFKVLHQLRASNLKIPAVILLDSDERDLVVDAFRAGARGIFYRDSSFNTLPKCIRRIHEGEIWWVRLGVNVGYEIDGKSSDFSRPVIIIKKSSVQVHVMLLYIFLHTLRVLEYDNHHHLNK